MLLPGQQTLLLGRVPSWGVAVAHGRLPSPNCTCGWVSEGLLLSGGQMSSSSWEDGPGRALLGPWPGLLVKLQGWLW